MTTQLKPTDIHAYLLLKVLGQEEVLKQVAVSVYKHIKGIKCGNILLIGNSGTGKTTVMKAVFEFYLEHKELADYQTMLVLTANRLMDESGEVHIHQIFKNLETPVRNRLGNDVSPRELKTHIENAAVCLDEIDKISAKISDRVNVAGILIQQALLTILITAWSLSLFPVSAPSPYWRICVRIHSKRFCLMRLIHLLSTRKLFQNIWH